MYEEYEAIEEARQKLREEAIDKQTSTDLAEVRKVAKAGKAEGGKDRDDDFGSSEDEDEDADKYAEAADAVGQKLDTKTRITVRNLRIREDTAKYLINLDPSSAYYDPKTRSMRDNPLKNVPAEEVSITLITFLVDCDASFIGSIRWRELPAVLRRGRRSSKAAALRLECRCSRQRCAHEREPNGGRASSSSVQEEERRAQGYDESQHTGEVWWRGVSGEGSEGAAARSNGGVRRVLADRTGCEGQGASESKIEVSRGRCVQIPTYIGTLTKRQSYSILQQSYRDMGFMVRSGVWAVGFCMLPFNCPSVLLYRRGWYCCCPGLERPAPAGFVVVRPS